MPKSSFASGFGRRVELCDLCCDGVRDRHVPMERGATAPGGTAAGELPWMASEHCPRGEPICRAALGGADQVEEAEGIVAAAATGGVDGAIRK